jgi:hypothetical protein
MSTQMMGKEGSMIKLHPPNGRFPSAGSAFSSMIITTETVVFYEGNGGSQDINHIPYDSFANRLSVAWIKQQRNPT